MYNQRQKNTKNMYIKQPKTNKLYTVLTPYIVIITLYITISLLATLGQ